MESKPSKSARKRDSTALQALGEELMRLTEDELIALELNEDLMHAIMAAAKIRSRGALRRQRQLIGKLMRQVDPWPIRSALESLKRRDELEKALFRRAESWRDRILQAGCPALDEFIEQTGVDNAELSTAVARFIGPSSEIERRAIKKKIFRLVREQLAATVQNDGR